MAPLFEHHGIQLRTPELGGMRETAAAPLDSCCCSPSRQGW